MSGGCLLRIGPGCHTACTLRSAIVCTEAQHFARPFVLSRVHHRPRPGPKIFLKERSINYSIVRRGGAKWQSFVKRKKTSIVFVLECFGWFFDSHLHQIIILASIFCRTHLCAAASRISLTFWLRIALKSAALLVLVLPVPCRSISYLIESQGHRLRKLARKPLALWSPFSRHLNTFRS